VAWVKLAALIIVSGLAGALLFQLTNEKSPDPTTVEQTTEPFSADDNTRPFFSLPDLEGVEHSISEWDGKLLLINFWASWCPPCIKEMPALDEIRQLYMADGFEILGVAIEPAEDVATYLARSPVSYPVVHGEIAADRIARDYGNSIGSIPFSALINRNGQIIERYHGEIDLTALTKSIVENL